MIKKDGEPSSAEGNVANGPAEPASYPKILLVNSQVLGERSGLGSTLANLFRGWPLERIAQIVPQNSYCDLSLCRNNWPIFFPHHWQEGSGPALLGRLMRSRGFPLGPPLIAQVREFGPELIYSTLELPLITNLVARLARRFDVPIVPHMMDEWQGRPKGGRVADLWWFARQRYDFWRVLKRAPVGLAISAAMAQEYCERYRRPFHVFMNSADPDLYRPQQSLPEDGDLFRLVYAGAGPGLGRWPVVQEMMAAVRQLYREGWPVQFEVFTHLGALQNLPSQGEGVVLRDYCDEKCLADVLSTSDVALLPEGSDPDSIAYSRLSLSAKIPLYLMAGCSVVAAGHGQNNSIRYIRDNGLGPVLSEPNQASFHSLFRSMLTHREAVSRQGRFNRQFALRQHSRPQVHAAFVELLRREFGNHRQKPQQEAR